MNFGGKQEYWRQPTDLTVKIMIDPETGVVDAPGMMARGTNEYCAQRSQWQQLPGTPLTRLIIRECTTLRTSETAYTFSTTSVSRLKKGETVFNPVKNWASGTLNRITGAFDGQQKVESHYEDEAIELFERKMTCTPTMRRFSGAEMMRLNFYVGLIALDGFSSTSSRNFRPQREALVFLSLSSRYRSSSVSSCFW